MDQIDFHRYLPYFVKQTILHFKNNEEADQQQEIGNLKHKEEFFFPKRCSKNTYRKDENDVAIFIEKIQNGIFIRCPYNSQKIQIPRRYKCVESYQKEL